MSFGIWQRTIVDKAGNVLNGATVEVRVPSSDFTGSLVTIYSDEGSTAIGNPLTADSEGFAQFYASPQKVDIRATSDGVTRTWVNVPIPGTASTADAPRLANSPYASETGSTTANALDLTTDYTVAARTELVDGDRIRARITTTNTGAATLSVDGLTAKAVVTTSGAALTGGEIRTDIDSEFTYDAANDNYRVSGQGTAGYADTGTAGGEVPTNNDLPAAFNATGSAPLYACRAWVNFDGTGTVSIRASGNVSSITDNGTGAYAINFTTNPTDADYSAVTSAVRVPGVTEVFVSQGTLSTSNYTFNVVRDDTGANIDSDTLCGSIFR